MGKLPTPKHGRASLSEGQLAIMNIVWDRREVLVADVYGELSRQRVSV